MGVLEWLYGEKPETSGEAKTGSVEKAAMQISEQKKKKKIADCALKQMEYDPITGECV